MFELADQRGMDVAFSSERVSVQLHDRDHSPCLCTVHACVCVRLRVCPSLLSSLCA